MLRPMDNMNLRTVVNVKRLDIKHEVCVYGVKFVFEARLTI